MSWGLIAMLAGFGVGAVVIGYIVFKIGAQSPY